MQSLQDYLHDLSFQFDGHVHLFDTDNLLDDFVDNDIYKCRVGFIDIELDKVDKYKGDSVLNLYSNFIKKNYKENDILLAAGLEAEQAIDVYNKFPNIIKGFGEFKLYAELGDKRVHYDKLDGIYKVCEFNKDKNLPVYIHFELSNATKINNFKTLLETYPNIPIVLCHCGFSKDDNFNKNYILKEVLWLADNHPNLWLDTSWFANDFFNKNPLLIYNLPADRIIWGTDRSPKGKRNKTPDKLNNFFINNSQNIKRLFKI